MTRSESFTILSRDQFPLAATLVYSHGEPRGCVQINSATGVKKEIYTHFAVYLAEQGYHVLLFDYRGIGGSRPTSLRGFQAHNHEWGAKDMAAAVDWLHQQFPSLPIYAVGHSAGGQQLGFMDNHHKFKKMLAVSSSTGYWKHLASPYKYFTLFVWYGLEPVMNNTLGYLPASWFKLGEDLPKGVAKEWRRWCLSDSYYGQYLNGSLPNFFEQVKIPIHFVYPEDDTIATERSVEGLRRFYVNSPTSVQRLLLREYGMNEIGHFGFFSRKSREKLWPEALRFFNE